MNGVSPCWSALVKMQSIASSGKSSFSQVIHKLGLGTKSGFISVPSSSGTPTPDADGRCCRSQNTAADVPATDSLIVPQIHFLVLDRAPEPFHEDVVKCTVTAFHADRDEAIIEKPYVITRELQSMGAVEFSCVAVIGCPPCRVSVEGHEDPVAVEGEYDGTQN